MQSSTDSRDYRLARALRARILGVSLVSLGAAVLVGTVVVELADLPPGILAGLGALALIALAAVGVVVLGGWSILHLDEGGYRVRFVRAAGTTEARWAEVEDLATTVVAGTPCLVLRLRDGRTTTVPVTLLEGDREELVDELKRRLDTGHGYRRISAN